MGAYDVGHVWWVAGAAAVVVTDAVPWRGDPASLGWRCKEENSV